MKNVFDFERHEKLLKKEWDQSKVDHLCEAIISGTISAYDQEKLWPVHKLDSKDPQEYGHSDLYLGAAGIIWMLNYLGNNSINEHISINKILEDYLIKRNESEMKDSASLFFGEIGIRLLKEKLIPTQENRNNLSKLIESHIDNEFNEVLYGNQGTMLASYLLYQQNSEDRFKTLFNKTKEQVFKSWIWNKELSCYLWTQHFDNEFNFIGAAHGTFGNIHALMSCRGLLSENEISLIIERTSDLLQKLLVHSEDGNINWKPRIDSVAIPLMHWCHGAPGIICSVAHFLPRHEKVDAILRSAGESIWEAGPLKKGASLCHGTAGNAMAFLKLFNRFGDTLWLNRTKKFLMHSLDQCESFKSEYGHYRYPLWTGDLGIVLLNEEMKKGSSRLPIFDLF